MASYTVYSPCTGEIRGLDCYCNCQTCCVHKLAGPNSSTWSLPFDVSAATGVIRFWGGSNILSIKTIYQADCCMAAASCGNDVDNAVKCGVEVQLFKNSNAVSYIGSILYCHVRYRDSYIANGGIYNYSAYGGGAAIWSKTIGQAPSMPATYRECYQAVHSHMQVKGAGVTRNPASCYIPMTAGSSKVYIWAQ